MGILDRIMFWREKTDDPIADTEGYEIDGCFTLPADDVCAPETRGESAARESPNPGDQQPTTG